MTIEVESGRDAGDILEDFIEAYDKARKGREIANTSAKRDRYEREDD